MSVRADQHTAASCAWEQGGMCADNRPGHGLHAVQLRLAAATPSQWQDLLVVRVRNDGWVEAATLDGCPVSLWNHGDLTDVVAAGDPVALHPVYNVLSAGARRFNVLAESAA
ncbi:hypothetical protein GCM10027414_02630 [Humibacter ginsengiterrae]